MNEKKSVLKDFAEKQKIDLEKASARVSGFRENLKDEFVGEEYVSRSESIQQGKALRKEVPLDALGEWTVEKNRTKPNELLEAQDAARIQELIPLRHERMSVSPFTFYRGAAAVMAYDLSKLPTTGITVQAVGVGSVGTKAWMVVLEGTNGGDPLVLQIKEASASVLENYLPKSVFAEHGRRVVEGQRAIQTAGDVLLGWMRIPLESGNADYYVRQLWDAKGSADLTKINPEGLAGLGAVCAWTLAHAHAKTGSRHAIAGYLGKKTDFEDAMVKFADAYADQNEADYEAFLKRFG